MARSQTALPERPSQLPVSPSPTLWIDVTGLLTWIGQPTGIPRVIALLAQHLLQQPGLSVRLCKLVPTQRGFCQVAADPCQTRLNEQFQRRTPFLVWGYQRIGQVAQDLKQGNSPLARKLPREMREPLGRSINLVRELACLAVKALRAPLRYLQARCFEKPVPFQPGDVLLDLGVSWGYPNYGQWVAQLKQRQGIRYALLVHDLIPWRCPQLFPEEAACEFVEWAEQAVPTADLLVVTSQSTKRDVDAYTKALQVPCPPVGIMPLGVDIPSAVPEEEPLPAAIDRPFVLCVGTLEVRKNHLLLYHVWRKLVQEHPQEAPLLVLVGRPGWLVRDLLSQIANDPLVRDRIKILNGLSDRVLARLYRECLFTVYPSFYEGWGLPVSESLAFGKPCITSSSSSLPEAGGEFCEYHEPMDFARCYELVCRSILDAEFRRQWETRIRQHYQPWSWQQSQEQLLSHLVAHFGLQPEAKSNAASCG